MLEPRHGHEGSGFTKDSQMFIFKIQRANNGGGGDYSVKISCVLFPCCCGLDKLSHEGRTCSFAELHFQTLKFSSKNLHIRTGNIFNFVILIAPVSRKLRSACKI